MILSSAIKCATNAMHWIVFPNPISSAKIPFILFSWRSFIHWSPSSWYSLMCVPVTSSGWRVEIGTPFNTRLLFSLNFFFSSGLELMAAKMSSLQNNCFRCLWGRELMLRLVSFLLFTWVRICLELIWAAFNFSWLRVW